MAEQHDKKYKVGGGGNLSGLLGLFLGLLFPWTNEDDRSEVGPLAAGRVDVFEIPVLPGSGCC